MQQRQQQQISFFHNTIKHGISENRERDESFESMIRFRIIIVLHYYLSFPRVKTKKKQNLNEQTNPNGIRYVRHSSRTSRTFEHYNLTKHAKL